MSIEIFQSSRKKKELKVLFLSRRDSCRAPIADTIFNHLADKYSNRTFNKFNWRSSSAGLEVSQGAQGKLPDQKTLRVLNENHLETMHGCRQVS
jgi:protein-tyrosine-phosphatase